MRYMHVSYQRLAALLIAIRLLPACGAWAEAFHVHRTVPLDISPSGEKVTVHTGMNDGLVIRLPEERGLIQGIEIHIKIPPEVASGTEGATWTLYNDVTPSPSEQSSDYTGIVGATGEFGTSLSQNIKIPLDSENSIKKDAYSHYIPSPPDKTDGKIFIRLRCGEQDGGAVLEITGRPIFVNRGRLVLRATGPGGSTPLPYSVFIDGRSMTLSDSELYLAPGLHDVSLVSDYYRNEARTVHVEQARTTVLRVQFKSIAPLLRLVAPAATTVTVDGESVRTLNTFFAIAPGDHTVRFAIGDYEIVKTISAANGRNYTVSVAIDATVTEEE